MTVGDFTSVINAITLLSDNLLRYSFILTEFGSHAMFVGDYWEVMSLEPKLYNDTSNIKLSEVKVNSIKLEHVYYSYIDDPHVLKDVSFSVNVGEKIALVGQNGAGKTTLIRLLEGLYKSQRGKVLINNTDILEYNTRDYYSQIAYVDQNYHVYALPLKENLNMQNGMTDVDDATVQVLLNKVGMGKDLFDLDKGMETPLSVEFDEGGIELSGGQEQKIAIVRALVKKAQILFMDEPSSALDPYSEEKIYELIEELEKDKIVFVVSHRLSCVKKMDKILYMEDGFIKEQGTHDELMALKGGYAAAFNLQAERYRM